MAVRYLGSGGQGREEDPVRLKGTCEGSPKSVRKTEICSEEGHINSKLIHGMTNLCKIFSECERTITVKPVVPIRYTN